MNLQNDKIAFLKYCIPARLLLAYGIYKTPQEYMKYWIIPTSLVGFGFCNEYIKHNDKNPVSSFGQTVWWNAFRPIHMLFIILFIILILTNTYNAKIIPIVDILFSLIIFYIKYHNDSS